MSLRADSDGGDGNTLTGHFSVFNSWYEVDDWYEGRFLERIAPGAFERTFRERSGQIKVLYDHGHDPSIGNKPLGIPSVLREDAQGGYYEVPLFDTSYNRDLKPGLLAGAYGASFRFRVNDETWVEPEERSEHNPGKVPERTINDVDLYEFGPVTFPASPAASAGLRSMTGEFYDRLINDPLFVARFTERAGLKVAEHVLATLPPTSQRGETPPEQPATPLPTPDDSAGGQSNPIDHSHAARKRVARQIAAGRPAAGKD